MNLERLREMRGAVLGLALAALAALVVWQVFVLVDHHRADGRRQDAIDVAQAQVLDLTTLDGTTVDSHIASMSARVTGAFKQQFDGFAKTFASVVAKDKIRVTGRIDSSALSSYAEDAATVLVASTADVATGAKASPTERSYRMSVDLSRIGGKWLISGMEFVK